MTADHPGPAPGRRLDSWKEIAVHLGRDVRTVQRWEKFEGLPVHRLRHQRRGAVHAFTTELDEWWRQRSALGLPSTSSRGQGRFARFLSRHRTAAVVLAVVAMAPIGWHLSRGRVEIASVQVVDGRLVARSPAGRELWSAEPAGGPALGISRAHPGGRGTAIADIDGDGEAEVLVSVTSPGESQSMQIDILHCFGADGRLRWTKRLDDRLAFRSGEYGPPWRTNDVVVFAGPAGPRIAWSVQHGVWWPSLLVTLDAAGRVEQRFVHAGWLGRIEPIADGRHLAVAGLGNEHDGSVLIAFDAERISGYIPAEAGSPYECIDCLARVPRRYFRFPRAEGSRGLPLHLLMPGIERTLEGGVIARVDHDGADGGSESIYEISDRLDLTRASFSDAYWQRHRRLEQSGALLHGAADCPERDGPPVFGLVGSAWVRMHPDVKAASRAVSQP